MTIVRVSTGESAYPARSGAPWAARSRSLVRSIPRPRPELCVLLAIAGVLNLWDLSRNGWANTYYSAAVRSMSASWHNFLFASFDPSGVMTVDKPPLAFWVQAVSARLFGFHSLSLLVPQALMGMASVALVYDLTRRVWGRSAGFVAGLVLATTPMTVATSRHNNPDALLVLCCVAAVWCMVRAFADGRTRWIVGAGVCVGLGFETKMGAALLIVPAIALAWLWVAPRGRMRALRALLAGGAAMVVIGGAWPLLVTLTPAADRPWISGTNDNSVVSLILGYNGLGRLDGQAGGPQILGGGPGGPGVFGVGGPFGGAGSSGGAASGLGGAAGSNGAGSSTGAASGLGGAAGSNGAGSSTGAVSGLGGAAGSSGAGGVAAGSGAIAGTSSGPGPANGVPGAFAAGGPVGAGGPGGGGGPGGPGGGAAGPFGGSTGPLRLLNSSLGGQAGWLMGFAIVAAILLAAASRLRRGDPATGWQLLIGGSFVTIAAAFSFARGIFHPYYVSQLAPFTAALVGAGFARLVAGDRLGRVLAAVAIAAGVATELAVLHDYPGDLSSLPVILLTVGALAGVTLAVVAGHSRASGEPATQATARARVRGGAAALALGALLIGPAVWSAQTLGYATSTTFPAGGSQSLSSGGGAGFGPPGATGGFANGRGRLALAAGAGAAPPSVGSGTGSAAAQPLFGNGGPPAAGGSAGGSVGSQGGFAGGLGFAGGQGGPGGFAGGPGEEAGLTQALKYAAAHGGGTVAVSSQSGAAAQAIITSGTHVAGIGGFSGRESEVSAAWLAGEVREGRIRWVLADGASGFGGFAGFGGSTTSAASGASATAGAGRDTRPGATPALEAVTKACRAVSTTTSAAGGGLGSGVSGSLYDCRGRAAALASS